MKLRKTIPMLLAVSMSVGMSAAQAKDKIDVDKDKITIGMVNLLNRSAYFTAMDTAVHREAAAHKNITVISTDAGNDAAKMASDINDLLAKKVSGLIISAGPTETLPASLAAIQAAGIPVVFVDRLWKNTNLTTPWNWVGAQNSVMGEELGMHVREKLGGKGNVLIIRGGPADNSIGLDRSNGFLSKLSGSAIKVTKAPGFGGWANDGGYKVMADMLVKMPKIDAVFCENDAMCLGAQKAAQAQGRSNEMIFVAPDGSKEVLAEMMRPGSNFSATAINDSAQIGRTGFQHLLELLKGQKLPKLSPLPSPLVQQQDAKKLYDPNKVF
jgi:ribose transport system substrate-binding protein